MLKKIFAALLALLAAAAFAAVDVNKASQAELESIKGIGPALSQRLLDERKKSAFKDWPDVIERVKGIGSGNAARFSSGGLTVGGTAYAGTPAAATATAPAASRSAKTAASRPTTGVSTPSAVADKPTPGRVAASGADRPARKASDAAASMPKPAMPTAASGASATKTGAKP